MDTSTKTACENDIFLRPKIYSLYLDYKFYMWFQLEIKN